MFKELKGKKINSIVINDQKSVIVFRDADDKLYFYEGGVASVKGMAVLDMKYGVGLDGAFVIKTKLNKIFTSDGDIVVEGGPFVFAGAILEKILKSKDTFSQLFEDF